MMVVRYEAVLDSFSNCFCAMERDDSGEYVSYEAYAELQATIAELEKEQQELVYDCRDYRIKCEAQKLTIAELREALQRIYDNAGDHDLIVDVASDALLEKNDGLV